MDIGKRHCIYVDLARAYELYLESANAGYGKGMDNSDPDAVERAKKELSIE